MFTHPLSWGIESLTSPFGRGRPRRGRVRALCQRANNPRVVPPMKPFLILLALFTTNPASAKDLKNLSYGADPAQRMDMFAADSAKNAPVIFMVHGGGWRRGDKAMPGVAKNKAARWRPKGIVVISANYRMVPEANPLEQADDLARAIAYAQDNATSWGGDPNKFVLMGHSAGAHLVSLLNAQPERATKLGARPWLGTVSLDSAGYDMVKLMEARHARLYDIAFGTDKQLWRDASPSHVIEKGAKPLLAVCSTKRPDDPCSQAYSFAAKATSLLARVEVLQQPLSHGQINAQLGQQNSYTAAVEKFMASLDPQLKQLLSAR
jgi:arylformamidase